MTIANLKELHDELARLRDAKAISGAEYADGGDVQTATCEMGKSAAYSHAAKLVAELIRRAGFRLRNAQSASINAEKTPDQRLWWEGKADAYSRILGDDNGTS